MADSTSTLGLADWAHIFENARRVPQTHPDYPLAVKAMQMASDSIPAIIQGQNAADSAGVAPNKLQSLVVGAADAASLGIGPVIGQMGPSTAAPTPLHMAQGGPSAMGPQGFGVGSQDFLKSASTTNPWTTLAGEVLGGLPVSAGAGAMASTARLASPLAAAGTVGAVESGLHTLINPSSPGVLHFTGDRGYDTAINAAIGGMLGAGGAAVVNKVAGTFGTLVKLFSRYGTDEQAQAAAATIVGKRLATAAPAATKTAEETVAGMPISQLRTTLIKGGTNMRAMTPEEADGVIARMKAQASPPPPPPQVRTGSGGVQTSIPVKPPSPIVPDPNDVQGFLRRVGIARAAETRAPMDATAARLSGVPTPPNVMGQTAPVEGTSFDEFIRGKGAGGQPAGEAATQYRKALDQARSRAWSSAKIGVTPGPEDAARAQAQLEMLKHLGITYGGETGRPAP